MWATPGLASHDRARGFDASLEPAQKQRGARGDAASVLLCAPVAPIVTERVSRHGAGKATSGWQRHVPSLPPRCMRASCARACVRARARCLTCSMGNLLFSMQTWLCLFVMPVHLCLLRLLRKLRRQPFLEQQVTKASNLAALMLRRILPRCRCQTLRRHGWPAKDSLRSASMRSCKLSLWPPHCFDACGVAECYQVRVWCLSTGAKRRQATQPASVTTPRSLACLHFWCQCVASLEGRTLCTCDRS